MKLAIGIDVGGTKIAAGMVDTETGRVLKRHQVPSPPDGESALAIVRDLAGKVAATTGVTSIGVGVPEIVTAEGEITSASTWDWTSADIRGALSEFENILIESDVRAAALAEAHFGAGTGLDHFVYLTIGTNISSSLVESGKPVTGRVGAALVVGAPPVEAVAGGRALGNAAGDPDVNSVIDDPLHASLMAAAVARLGEEAARIVNLLDPEALIVGGSLGLNESYRLRWVEHMRLAVWHPAAAEVPVLPARLAADSGVVGAALSSTRASM